MTVQHKHDNRESSPHDVEVTALRQELEALRAEFAAFRAAVSPIMEQMHPPVIPPAATSEPAADDHEQGQSIAIASRRDLLKWGGLGAAAALAAAGGAGLTSQTAHAANGANFVLGQANTAEHTTALTYDGTETAPLVLDVDAAAHNGSTGISVSVGDAADTGGIQTIGIKSTAGAGVSTFGIYGTAGSLAVGIYGSGGAVGVFGNSSGGVGVVGVSETGRDISAGGTGRIYQSPTTFVGPPTSGTYFMGEQIRDLNNDLFICVWDGFGAPPGGVWKKVAALSTDYRGGAIGFLSSPIRIYDSRKTGGALVGNATRDVQVTGVNIGSVQVPLGATGCIGNLTVTGATAGGYVVIYPAGSATPTSSTVNFQSGQTVANAFAVGLSGSGQVTVHSFTSGTVHFILDITGFVA